MSGEKRTPSFLKGATLIMLATVVAKILGAAYRIPLTNILGAEGMGVYQLIYPVYALILTTSSGALPISTSVLVASATGRGDIEQVRKLVRSAMSALLMIGVVLTAALVMFSPLVGKLQGSDDTMLGYAAIAPAIIFVSGIAVLKGYFQGNGLMMPTALSQISEALVKLTVGLTLAYLLMRFGKSVAVAGALVGVTIAEGVTLLILYIFYRRNNPPLMLTFDYKEAKTEYKAIIAMSLPITVGSMIFPVTQFADSFLVINILSRSMDVSLATAMYGLYSGPVNTLVNLPVTLGLSLGIAVVPHLAKNKAEHDIEAIRLKLATAVKVAIAIGVPFTALFISAPEAVIGLLYPSLKPSELASATTLLRIAAPSVIALAVMQICISVQQGLGDTKTPVKISAIAGVVKIVLDVVLLFTVGIIGVEIASLVAYLVGGAGNAYALFKLTGKNSDISKNSGAILLSGVIICAVVPVAAEYASISVTLAVAAACGAVYVMLLYVLPIFKRSELRSLPLGDKLIALDAKLKIKRAE